MPATALSQQPTRTEHLPDVIGRIPPKIRKAIRLLVSGECKTQSAAAARAEMSPTYLCEQLAKPKIQAFIARETRRAIQNGTMRATARLIELLDAKSDPTAAQVAQRILTDQGILKSDQRDMNVNVAVSAGFVVDLSNPVSKPVVTIDAE